MTLVPIYSISSFLTFIPPLALLIRFSSSYHSFLVNLRKRYHDFAKFAISSYLFFLMPRWFDILLLLTSFFPHALLINALLIHAFANSIFFLHLFVFIIQMARWSVIWAWRMWITWSRTFTTPYSRCSSTSMASDARICWYVLLCKFLHSHAHIGAYIGAYLLCRMIAILEYVNGGMLAWLTNTQLTLTPCILLQTVQPAVTVTPADSLALVVAKLKAVKVQYVCFVACACACVCACVCAFVCVCVRACARACVCFTLLVLRTVDSQQHITQSPHKHTAELSIHICVRFCVKKLIVAFPFFHLLALFQYFLMFITVACTYGLTSSLYLLASSVWATLCVCLHTASNSHSACFITHLV